MATPVLPGKTQSVPMTPLRNTGLPSDERRAQELDQYYTPSQNSVLKLTDRDSALPAHMQLICWRLNVRRALVSLINRDTQYYVAESTRTMDLYDHDKFEDQDDAPMSLDESHLNTGVLCAETIKAMVGSDRQPPYFEVCDLASDTRFSQLNIVENLGLFYYCGVPIRTNNNIVIGTVFALDDKVREPLAIQHIHFLASIADNVMVHLENRKQKMDVVRIMKMNKSLASFMDSDLDKTSQTPPEEPAVRGFDSLSCGEPGSRRDSTGTTSEEELPSGDDGREYSQIFSRAATFLGQSLSLADNGGGVLFLDTAPKSIGRISAAHRSSRFESGAKNNPYRISVSTLQPSRTPSDEFVDRDTGRDTVAAMLACNVCVASLGDPDQACLNETTPANIPVKCLLKFIKRAPGGQVYHYPELREAITEDHLNSATPQHHTNSEETEIRNLFSHLPGACEMILVPLWNTHLGRWTVCLVYTLSNELKFSFEVDYFFCRAFCNCVKAEIDRCTVVLSDHQKGDFIGSVSHELRSPLHGILASCELIQETELSTFQKSLIDTTESCSHTLLDTIQNVLDFSKVNAFTKDHPGRSLDIRPHVVKGGVEPLISTYSHVNVAAIVEEVIEGVTTGHLAKSDPSLEMGFVGERAKSGAKTFEDLLAMPQSPVEIILDVRPPQDWTFVTQPGAYRRIIMNVFGNSLKYTDSGYIKISLKCDDMDQESSEPTTAMVVLRVEDSGKGISQAYMNTRMFTAFAQENPLAPGTGLGLSLVKSLVEMMHGEIEVQSEVNQGTIVTVKMPMKRADPQQPRDSFHRPNEDDIQVLRTIEPRPRIMNFQQDVLPEDTPLKQKGYELQKHALAACINGWFKIDDLHDWDMVAKPDVVLVDDGHLLAITRYLKRLEEHDAVVLVLCSDRSRTTAILNAISYTKLHVMPKPFGPFKLSRALKHALDKRGSPGTLVPDISKEMRGIPEIKQPSRNLRRTNSDAQDLPGMFGARKSSIGGQSPSFPFPVMDVTGPPASSPLSRCPTPPLPATSHQIDVLGTHHRRLKTLDVPLAKQQPTAKHDELLRSQSDSQVTKAQHIQSKPRILLVDDSDVNLNVLQTFLVRRNYKDVRLARDGREAVEVYEDALRHMNRFNVVFMDISMPVMDGFEATRIIRRIEASVAAQHSHQSSEPYMSLIIALTGNASAEDQRDAYNNGLDLYMTKPVSLRDIGSLMKAWEEKAAAHGIDGARTRLLESNATAEEQ